MIDFFIKVKQQEEQHLPFVVYCKPNKNKLIGLFQKNDHLYFSEDFSETGFVFAPFDEGPIILIPKRESERWTAQKDNSSEKHFSVSISTKENPAKEHFEQLVQKGIHAIEKGFFAKVVLSREEILDVPDFDIVSVFEKLVEAYPSAFTYCWFHPKIGLWMGATPERLLKSENSKFSTMSLAGTQPFQGLSDVIWDHKEKEEQQLVTDFILDNLKKVTSEIIVSSPYTLKAGNVIHIKTDIEGLINQDSDLKEVVTILHPTPAVCGLPKKVAKEFITDNEGYSRDYYTGFLGELNFQSANKAKLKSDLYVNLRCMQIKHKKAHLYVGCGITKESIPEKEWIETVNKSLTMKKIIL